MQYHEGFLLKATSGNVLELPEQMLNQTSLQPPKASPRPSKRDNVAHRQKPLTALRPQLQRNSVRLPPQPALMAMTFIAKHKLRRRRRAEVLRIETTRVESRRDLEDEARRSQLRELGAKLQVLIFITMGLVISSSYRNHFADMSPSDTSPQQRPLRMHVDLKVEIWGLEMDVGLVLLLLLMMRRQVMEAVHNNINTEIRGNRGTVETHTTTTYANITNIKGNGNYVAETGTMEKVTASAEVTVEVPPE